MTPTTYNALHFFDGAVAFEAQHGKASLDPTPDTCLTALKIMLLIEPDPELTEIERALAEADARQEALCRRLEAERLAPTASSPVPGSLRRSAAQPPRVQSSPPPAVPR